MKFTSNWTRGTVFWRTFVKNDTVYVIGLKEGTIGTGGTVEYDNPQGFFQLELKRGGLFGAPIVPAGRVLSNDDEYILLDDGQFVPVEDATTVTIDHGFRFEPAGGVVQFFTAAGSDSTVKVTSTLSQTVNQSGQAQRTVTSEATDENGTQVGAKESASGGQDGGVKLGVELSQAASSKVVSKISRVVSSQLSLSVSTQTTYSEEQTIVCKANRLTALETSWQRRYVTGSAALGATHLSFDATLGYITSRNATEYASPDLLPPDLMAAYREQFPDYHPPVDLHDGAVLREVDSAPVDVIFGGARFWVPDPTVLERLYGGWAAVQLVPHGALAGVPTTPRDGTLLREEDHPEVWLMHGGAKRHVTSPDVLSAHGGWGQVRVVPDESMASFPVGDPVTA